MNEPNEPTSAEPRSDTDRQVHLLSAAFEREWKEGRHPRIEDYLKRGSGLARLKLLRTLLAVELEQRRLSGEDPPLIEYEQRFADDKVIVRSAFELLRSSTDPDFVSTIETRQSRGSPSNAALWRVESLPTQLDRFNLEQLLGSGSFGSVYLAHDSQLNRKVAIKVAHLKRFATTNAIHEFLEEARTAAQLKHPGLVVVHDVQHQPGRPPFIVQEYIEGRNLAAWAADETPSPEQVARLLIEIAEAVGYAHQRGFVHRDLKPANIIVDADGHAHVADFGLAVHESDQYQREGERAGTPGYMPPELARGESHRLDGRSDIWSLGVILYELLVGQRPFRAGSREELFDAIENREPKPMRQLRPAMSRELERICLRCLAKRMTDRYASTRDLADDLQHWLQHGENRRLESAAASNLDQSQKRVVPKGLTAFSSEDADFFLELVPGPRDRDGMPDSIRFWKNRIEETDPDHTFPVGLMYGTSGCGKSSLVKAGLIPRLSDRIVTVYVEATADGTEARLLKSLRKLFPDLPTNLNLPLVFRELRRRLSAASAKLLVVVDQFEQWLHAHQAHSSAELVEAFRQCDGGRLQCLVLSRDDFSMAVNRFFQQLEVRLVEGHNFALVDLFDPDHASKVLRSFGRAFERLPGDESALTVEQRQFVTQAVNDLERDGKVVCVHLALFADMMKGRPWTPASLAQVGGVGGVGMTFLQETFDAKAALPSHRHHREAAQRVLRQLLPTAGTDIRGGSKSYEELLRASGYEDKPHEFEDLLTILDQEVRLLAPADAEEPEATGKKFYQLTHDYLVHSVREWLTRKQRESWRGRAALRLTELSQDWSRTRQRQFLPSMIEWLLIKTLVRHRDISHSERSLMQAASRHHLIRLAAAMGLLLAASAVAWRAVYASRRNRAESLVENALSARPAEVPYAVALLTPMKHHAIDYARAAFATSTDRRKLHAAFVLAALDSPDVDYLIDSIGTASPDDCGNVTQSLNHKRGVAIPKLRQRWRVEQNPSTRSRLALTMLYLGDDQAARQAAALDEDPTDRTDFILELAASWYGDLLRVDESLLTTDDDSLQSAICIGVGMIPPARLSYDERVRLSSSLQKLFTNRTSGGMHGAAEWALRQWRIPDPEVTHVTWKPNDGWFINQVGMTLVRIPAATDLPNPERLSRSQRKPDRPFFMSSCEVSVKQFREYFYASNRRDNIPPSAVLQWDDPGNVCEPMRSVSPEDAALFCNWLSCQHGLEEVYTIEQIQSESAEDKQMWRITQRNPAANGYRLPTEEEWEYACRCLSETSFSFGRRPEDLVYHGVFAKNAPLNGPAGLGSKIPNGWGLFDMHGNVAELCDSHLTEASAVHRGGHWAVVMAEACASDLVSQWHLPSSTVGFRVVCLSPGK